MDSFIGEIRMFAGSYAPENWHICDGTLLKVAEYQPLFALIGVTYGGDGVTTFALPNLQGRVPIGQGTGTGLTARVAGQTGGATTVGLAIAEYPTHTHTLNATTTAATSNIPTDALPATPATGGLYCPAPTAAAVVALADQALAPTGGASVPHANVMPSMGMTYIISLLGIFPDRSN